MYSKRDYENYKQDYYKRTLTFIKHLSEAFKNSSSFGIAKTENHLKIYCLDPSLSIKSIQNARPKKLIFISGTLPDKKRMENMYNLKFGEENKF